VDETITMRAVAAVALGIVIVSSAHRLLAQST
jgi:hypothetical protein